MLGALEAEYNRAQTLRVENLVAAENLASHMQITYAQFQRVWDDLSRFEPGYGHGPANPQYVASQGEQWASGIGITKNIPVVI